MKIAFVFPGQGSQSVGMLAGYGDAPEVRDVLAIASGVLKQDLGKLMAEGPVDPTRPDPPNREHGYELHYTTD